MVQALEAMSKLKKLDFEHTFSLRWQEDLELWCISVLRRDNSVAFWAEGKTLELAGEALLVKVM